MNAAPSLFSSEPAAPRRERHANPIATPADLARKREIMALFTFVSPVGGWIAWGLATPAEALTRLLDHMGLSPFSVAVEAHPATPDTVEIRDEREKNCPRHILALVHEGLNIAEARAALAHLRAPQAAPPKSKR